LQSCITWPPCSTRVGGLDMDLFWKQRQTNKNIVAGNLKVSNVETHR